MNRPSPTEGAIASVMTMIAPEKELNLDRVNAELENRSAREIIRWAHQTFGTRLGMLSSMQRTAAALTHMLYAEGLTDVEILFIDTGYHFPETLEYRDRLVREYGVNIKSHAPEKTPEEQFREYGRELYLRDGDYQLCCRLRKEIPFVKAAEPFSALLSGLMRSEGGARKNTPPVIYDHRIDAYKIHPLLHWTKEEVDEYNDVNNVPVHPLHDRGYPSIGCRTCTTPVKLGEDERAGRWRHIREANPGGAEKLYCGINLVDRNNRG